MTVLVAGVAQQRELRKKSARILVVFGISNGEGDALPRGATEGRQGFCSND